ncbi:hypothetical protein ACE1ET_02955 [Saccharicrinis sp. FJH62]|uniref:DUF7033 domain-containing protein n=1 Tax=Saccharicrinis sp. FJH62 TaxID=3344657 RepID=UPI0035D4C9F3
MNKVIVITNELNYEEKSYIFSFLFSDYFQIPYKIKIEKHCETYNFIFSDKKLIFKDEFFRYFAEPLSYLSEKNIPTNLERISFNDVVKDIPVIYGDNKILTSTDEIYCGLDIVASCFFLLTRWEEYVIANRYKDNRPVESSLLSIKNSFYDQPVVNEYLKLVESFFQILKIPYFIPERKFSIKLSHDVDWLYLSSQNQLWKNISKRIFIKKQTLHSLKIIYRYYYYRLSRINPFDPFDELLEIGNKFNLNLAFYFKAVEEGEKGFTYSIKHNRVSNIIQKISKAGFEIGFHPSENTVNNDNQFEIEANRLKEIAGSNIKGGRNHGLYYFKDTFNQWEKNDFSYDAGLGFQFVNGFRCGICHDFYIFDIYNRKKLNLKEIPFVAMDTTVLRNKLQPHELFSDVVRIIQTVKRFNGNVTFNWHSNLINTIDLKKYKEVYIRILNYIGGLK